MPKRRASKSRRRHRSRSLKRSRARKMRGGLFLSREACRKRLSKTAESRLSDKKTGIVGRLRHRIHKSICKRLYKSDASEIKEAKNKALAELQKERSKIDAEIQTVKQIGNEIKTNKSNSFSNTIGPPRTSFRRSVTRTPPKNNFTAATSPKQKASRQRKTAVTATQTVNTPLVANSATQASLRGTFYDPPISVLQKPVVSSGFVPSSTIMSAAATPSLTVNPIKARKAPKPIPSWKLREQQAINKHIDVRGMGKNKFNLPG